MADEPGVPERQKRLPHTEGGAAVTRPGAPEPAHPLGTESTATGPAYHDDPHLARWWGDRGCTCTYAYIDLGFHPIGRIWGGYGWVLKRRDPTCPPHNAHTANQQHHQPTRRRT